MRLSLNELQSEERHIIILIISKQLNQRADLIVSQISHVLWFQAHRKYKVIFHDGSHVFIKTDEMQQHLS